MENTCEIIDSSYQLIDHAAYQLEKINDLI